MHLPTDTTFRTGNTFTARDSRKVDLVHMGFIALASVAGKHDFILEVAISSNLTVGFFRDSERVK